MELQLDLERTPKWFFGGRYADSPFKYLDVVGPSAKSVFEMHGAQSTIDMSLADCVVLLDMDASSIDQIIKFDVPKEKCILIRSEPLCVLPENYDLELLSRIGLIIESGASRVSTGISINRGQYWPQSIEQTPQANKVDQVVLVNSNQLSFIKGELYSLRRECIHRIDQVVLYGKGWDITFSRKLVIATFHFWRCVRYRLRPQVRSLKFFFNQPKIYRGALDDKLGEMAKFKYALVIENSMQHLTEKLFDAFFAKCIPIYVGPKVADFGIPSDLVIQAEPTIVGVRNAMKRASEVDPTLWSTSVNLWLNQEDIRKEWEANAVVSRTIGEIHKYLGFRSISESE